MTYTLIRTTPEGVEKDSGPQARVRDAAVAAAYVLHGNARTPKAEAQRFSVLLRTAPLGETVKHEPSGYAFRIVCN